VSLEAASSSPKASKPSPAEVALLFSVFVVAACGLVYELAAGALASYVLGDSVLQFSTVIGTYLFAMGLGSYASRFFERQLVAHFLRIELLVGLIGGFLPATLFVLYNLAPSSFRPALYGLVMVVGALAGLEIPLVMRILKRYFSERYALKDLLAQVLTFDYLGALAVSVAFPLLLVPHLGLIRTGLLFGLLNAAVAAWALWLFRAELRARWQHGLACIATLLALTVGFVYAEALTKWSEERLFGDAIVYAGSSPYQRVVVTSSGAGVRLFLNGNLQFHSRDEHRYHEALVHPAMAAQGAPREVLVLGGGDGLAVREALKWPSVQKITLVDLDPHITRLFSQEPLLTRLNGHALNHPKVKVINADAYRWLQDNPGTFDVIIVDFPDPSNFAIGKLYTTSFYQQLDQRLNAGGFAVVQTTSPLVARKSFWTVAATIEAVGLNTTPYHAHVPSFGEWGFIIASRRPYRLPDKLPEGLRFLTPRGMAGLLDFPPDMARVEAEPNRLSNQILVQTFEAEWGAVR
jgi:spermidine synthase